MLEQRVEEICIVFRQKLFLTLPRHQVCLRRCVESRWTHLVLHQVSLVFLCLLSILEPGYYEDGKFGIRIENCMLITEAETQVGMTDGYAVRALCGIRRVGV